MANSTDSTEYQIEYSVQRRLPGDDDFTEIGFGSSGATGTITDASFAVSSCVDNYQWETAPGMPDPDTVRTAIEERDE